MAEREFKLGGLYRHFKGALYRVHHLPSTRKPQRIGGRRPSSFTVRGASEGFWQEVSDAGRELQEEFKRRWLTQVGPVMLRGASPETHSAEILNKAAIEVFEAQGALPKAGG